MQNIIEPKYGISEDPWPYEYLINALQFFSLSLEQLDAYRVPDFEPVLFHGHQGDFISANALESIITIFRDILHVGLSFDEWIDDPNLENIGLENNFELFYYALLDFKLEDLKTQWPLICLQAQSLLIKLNWPIGNLPDFSCKRMLNEYSYGAYQSSLISHET